jgi:two-component system, cell cycle sensor histidine kinase and response regulator CckA
MHLIHDLRLVLLAIAACLESLHDRAEANPLSRELKLVGRLLETGLVMIDDLLVSSALRPPTTHVDVNCLLEHLEAIVSTIVGSDVTVQTTLGASESRVCAQRVDIERILLNLVFNAAAAMPSGGKLVIKTSVTEPDPNEVSTNPAAPFGDLHLTISDTGRGMSDRALASAINPLARPRPDGTGLGLACVTLIITRLGGTLGIESREDGGTVVSIALPLSPGRNQIH